MRLEQYITEVKGKGEDLEKLILKDCKTYLDLLKGRMPLQRRSDTKPTTVAYGNIWYRIGELRAERKPKGYFHGPNNEKYWKRLNKLLFKMGHVGRDMCVTAIRNANTRLLDSSFGPNNYIFPIGYFDYTWVKAKDFNDTSGEFDVEQLLQYLGGFDDDFNEQEYDEQSAMRYISQFVTTGKGFDEAYKNNYEIWMDCKKYYAIYYSGSTELWLEKFMEKTK